jgi:hypothetical protein
LQFSTEKALETRVPILFRGTLRVGLGQSKQQKRIAGLETVRGGTRANESK